MSAAPPDPQKRERRRALLALVLLAVLPYLNALTGEFTYDDKLIVRDNGRIASPSHFGEIFTTHYFGGALATGTAYRPLLLVTFALQRWTTGATVWPFHAVNVFLHALATALLFLWLLRLGFCRAPAQAVAALFAVATIHVEAVTGIVGRADLLAAVTVLGAALLWLRATERSRLRVGPYLGCLALILCGVFTKENAVVAPGVILLGELFRGGRGAEPVSRLRAVIASRPAATAGLLAPIGVLFAARAIVLQGFLISKHAGIFDLENPLVLAPPLVRVAGAAGLLFRYVAKTLVPVGLSADHSAYALPMPQTLREPAAVLPIAALLLAALATGLLWRRRPLAAFGSALFFGAMLPTANILFPIGTIYAERLMYLPSAGVFAAAVGLLVPRERAVPRPSRLRWHEALVLIAVLAYSAGTLSRNLVYRNDTTLYADMVRKVPRSAKAHYNVAFDAQRRKDLATAKEHFRIATEIFPRYYDAWASLGRIVWDEGRPEEAIPLYRKSVEVFSTYENGRWGLAKTLQAAGRRADAEAAFEEGLRLLPDSYPLAFHLAQLLTDEDRVPEAETAWRRAIAVGKGAGRPHVALARLLVRVGREEEAWTEARKALAAEPGLVEARLFLAERYEEAGRILGAGGELSRARRSDPSDAGVTALLLELAGRHPSLRPRVRLALAAIEERFGSRPADERLRSALARFRAR